ncbi:MAG TPA: electron transfer flavoprotein subunit beta/FixA family protein [Vulgatibacter sp.]
MKILCAVKRVEDPEQKIKVKPDGSGIVLDGMNYKPNPYDEIAVEEALRLKEKQGGGEVVVVSIGDDKFVTELRHALAMGADRGILVKLAQPTDSDGAARLLAKVVEKEKPDLVICGRQAVDDDQAQTGQLLAEYLGWGQATFAAKVESLESAEEKSKVPGLQIDGNHVNVIREVDGGLEIVDVEMPAVVTTELRLNMPRYASLPGIMKAKKKTIEELGADALGVDVTPKVKVLKLESPPARKGGVKVADVATLMDKLKNEAKVI